MRILASNYVKSVLIGILRLMLMKYGFFQNVSELRSLFSVPRVTVIPGFHCTSIFCFIYSSTRRLHICSTSMYGDSIAIF